MSTSAVTLRWPQRARRSTIQRGVFAAVLTPVTMRPEKRPQRSPASTRTGSTWSIVADVLANVGVRSAAPVIAATSRATPKTLSAWPRFGVSLSVKIVSSRRSCSRRSAPTGASSSRTSRPSWSSESLSSRAEHIMPRLSTPRILPISMRNGSLAPSFAGGSSAPTSAHGAFMPARTFGAPQTIESGSPLPTSTAQTRKRSAFGWGSTASTLATTTPRNGGATGCIASTSRPAIVSRSASSTVPIGGSQNSRSQDSGNCIATSGELAEKPQIAVEEETEVVDAVAQHRETIDSRAERKADHALGIEPHVAHDLRMDLTRSGDLEPTACEGTIVEHQVDLGARLGERKVARPEAQLQRAALEERLDEIEVDRLEIAKAHVLAEPEPFDLVEHRRVRRVVVDAVGAAGRDDAKVGHPRCAGVLLCVRLRVADLHRRGVRTQVEPAAFVVLEVDVERVLHRARRMVLGVVERGEAVGVGLDLGTVGDVEAHRREDRLDPLERTADRMDAGAAARSPRQRHVERLCCELALELRFGEPGAARDERSVDRLLGGVDLGAAQLLLLGRERRERLQPLGDDSGLAEVARLGILELGGRPRSGEVRKGAVDDRLQIGHGRLVRLAPADAPAGTDRRQPQRSKFSSGADAPSR